MEKLLHPTEDARRLRSLGRTKFYQETNAGLITIVKAGGKSLVPQTSIEAYVERKIAEAKAARR